MCLQRLLDQRQSPPRPLHPLLKSLSVRSPYPLRFPFISPKQTPDPVERHLQITHCADDSGSLSLVRLIPAISSPPVNLSRYQQSGLVVVTKGRDGETCQTGELPDSEQVSPVGILLGHALEPTVYNWLRVKELYIRRGGFPASVWRSGLTASGRHRDEQPWSLPSLRILFSVGNAHAGRSRRPGHPTRTARAIPIGTSFRRPRTRIEIGAS